MKYKKRFIIICLVICLFTIASVCAGDVNETVVSNEVSDFVSLDEQCINQVTENNVTLKSENDNLIIDGNGTTVKGKTITGNNVTLMNYNFVGGSNGGIDYYPGAVNWKGNNGKIINCTFASNSGSPGALLITGINCTVINCTFKDNKLNAMQFGGAVVWNGANGTIINSNFIGSQSNNEGGAIYWCSPNGKVINCTFSNNHAWRGGAIQFGYLYNGKSVSSKNARIINSTFINNYDSQGGGAIYTWSGQDIIIDNCTFIQNSGSSIIASSGVKLINNSYFYKNTGTIGSSDNISNSLFYMNTGHVGAKNIKNSIFLNNTLKKDDTNPYITKTSNLEFNWFGNTVEDYQTTPEFGGILKNWLFLNATHERLMLVGEERRIAFVFQLWNGTDVLDYDSSKTYPLKLNLSATNGEINKMTSIVSENIVFNASSTGMGSITAELFDKKLTVNLTCKNPTGIAVSEPITIYVDQFMNFACDEFFAILNPAEAGTLHYSTDNGTILTLNDTGFKGFNEGNANILIEFEETEDYAPSNASVSVTVIRYDTEITANDTINIDFGDSTTIDAILNPNIGNVIYISDDANIAVVDKNGFISTIGAGTTNIIVKFEGDRKYKPSNKTIALTVNKIDSSIMLNGDFLFDYGGSDTVSTTVNGIKGINAFVLNHPEAIINFNNNRITVSKLNVGDYTLSVTTIPDNNHNAITTTANITVNKIDSLLVIPEIIFDYDSSASVSPIVQGVTGISDVGVINHPEANIIVKNNMIEISNLAIGTYTLTATTIPDSNHNAVTNTTKITVIKPDSSIKFTKEVTFDYGGSDTTTIILNGATGVTNVNVVNHPEAVITINNDKISVSGLDEGTYTLSATSVPDSNHNAITATTKITVMKYDSSIRFTNDIVFDYGSSASTNVILNGASGITNVKVINHPEAIVSIENNVITVSGLNTGSYTLTATTIPTKIYNAITGTAKIQVNKIDSSIKFTKDLVFDYGGSEFTSFVLNGVIGVDISVINYPDADVYFDGESISLYGLDAGNYKFSITTTPDRNHNSITLNVPFKVNKLNSNIIVKKINGYTASSTLKATVEDDEGNFIEEGIVKFVINGKTYNAKVRDSVAKITIKLSKAKTYSYKATFVSDNFYSTTASSKLVVKQSQVKISLNKITCISGDYFTLKAIVKNSAGKKLDEGSVKFSINGKTYKVNVKNGVATKKLKLSAVKTYIYKATFSSKYYKAKVGTSKVIVKKQPVYTVKIGKYSIKISYKDYKKIKNAKKDGYFTKQYYTGKTIAYKVYKDKKFTSTKKKLYSYGTYTTYYINNPDAMVAPNGYYFAGREFKTVNGIEKVYMVYKKSYYKKVLVSYKQAKVYITVDSNPWWGASAQLYHKEYVYYDKYGGVETKNYVGNNKKIF